MVEQPAADFDGAWKEALERFFEAFVALFFPQAHAGINWNQPVVVRDSELQQIAPQETSGKQRVDRLVQVVRQDGTPALVLIHIEIQSQRDPHFAERMFCYHARIFDRERQPVVSLAVLGDETPDWRPTAFGYNLWGCDLTLRFPVVKLRELDEELLSATRNPIATLTLLHRDAQTTRANPQERLRRKVLRYRAVLRQGYRADEIRALLRLMEYVLRLSPELAVQARNQLRQVEQEETGMDTFVTSFEEIGRAEGRVEGQRDLVLHLLTRKLGDLPGEVQAQVAALLPEQLLALGTALLDFTSLTELTAWLEAQT